MTVREWREQNPDKNCTIVWAADTHAGFGKKGWSVYGNCGDCEIISIIEKENSWADVELRVWNYALGDMQ